MSFGRCQEVPDRASSVRAGVGMGLQETSMQKGLCMQHETTLLRSEGFAWRRTALAENGHTALARLAVQEDGSSEARLRQQPNAWGLQHEHR